MGDAGREVDGQAQRAAARSPPAARVLLGNRELHLCFTGICTLQASLKDPERSLLAESIMSLTER